MNEYNSIEEVAEEIKNDLNSKNKNISIVYAFNSTGKTRMSTYLQNESEEKNTLCYNVFVEDMFTWDNENFIFHMVKDSWVIKLINEQGLENNIIENFHNIVNSKLEPSFNLNSGEITFTLATGDSNAKKGIKISKAEESIFIWSIFYTILECAMGCLAEKKEDRETDEFNDLKYVIIDDPVSSIDDTRIVIMAIKIRELIEAYNTNSNSNLKFLIMTHHALFFNVLYNELNKNTSYILIKNGNIYELKKQSNDTPFAYHLVVKNEIQKAITEKRIEKYHFNLFRTLLEKTGNFFGYKSWYECIKDDKNKKEFGRIVNLYSHGKLSDIEYNKLSNEDKDLFIEVFNKFIEDFNWGKVDEY